jgi:hypothetical protein
MNPRTDRIPLRYLFFLLIGLILVLQFPGELTHAAPLQQSSVSIQMSNPSCHQVLPASGECSLQIGSLIASGSDPSFSRVEVLVNGKLRIYMGGFFESSAYLTYPMMPGGLAVACGRPDDGGLPSYGKAYSLTANAFMVDGTSATDSLTVFCPAFDGKIYAPLVRKK